MAKIIITVVQIVCCTLFLFSITAPLSAAKQPIIVVTENYPPYNYLENGEIKGVSTEIVKAVLKEAQLDAQFYLYPWSRSYSLALSEPNILIYSIIRTPKREKLFSWVGNIASIYMDFYFFALQERTDIKLNSLRDINDYAVGTVRNDVVEQYLINKGITNIDRNNSHAANMKKLMLKRIDLWPVSEETAHYLLKASELDINSTLIKLYHIKEVSNKDLYMAFSKGTSDKLVNKVASALKRLKTDGTYDKILKKHIAE